MNYLKEKVAYLKGLADGMQISDSTNEGRLLKAIIEVLDDMALTVDDMEEVQEQLSEQIDDIDEDLAEVEKVLFDEYEDDDDDYLYTNELECPNCHEIIEIDDDVLEGETSIIECPHCHEKIELDEDCGCEDCSGHEH